VIEIFNFVSEFATLRNCSDTVFIMKNDIYRETIKIRFVYAGTIRKST